MVRLLSLVPIVPDICDRNLKIVCHYDEVIANKFCRTCGWGKNPTSH